MFYKNVLGSQIIYNSNNLTPAVMVDQALIDDDFRVSTSRWSVMIVFLRTRSDVLLPTLFLREPYGNALELEQNGLADFLRDDHVAHVMAFQSAPYVEEGICLLVKQADSLSTSVKDGLLRTADLKRRLADPVLTARVLNRRSPRDFSPSDR